jgi:hypothetical protein
MNNEELIKEKYFVERIIRKKNKLITPTEKKNETKTQL